LLIFKKYELKEQFLKIADSLKVAQEGYLKSFFITFGHKAPLPSHLFPGPEGGGQK